VSHEPPAAAVVDQDGGDAGLLAELLDGDGRRLRVGDVRRVVRGGSPVTPDRAGQDG
jgi:hypothetical protein